MMCLLGKASISITITNYECLAHKYGEKKAHRVLPSFFFAPTKPPNWKQLQFQKPNYSPKSKYESNNKRRASGVGEVKLSERHWCDEINLLTKLFLHFIWYSPCGKKTDETEIYN